MEKGIQLFIVIGFSILVGGVTGYFAEQRGRNSLVWFAIGVFFGFLGLIALFLLPSVKKTEGQESAPPTEVQPQKKPFEQELWFYLDVQHQQHGPVSFDELARLWKEKTLHSRSFIWSKEMADWKRIEEIPEVSDFLTN